MTQRQRIEVQQSLRLKLTTGLRAAIELLKFDATGLARHLEEVAEQNPALVLVPPAPRDWLPRWTGVLPGGSEGVSGGGASGTSIPRPDLVDQVAGPGPSLMAHVMAEIDRMVTAPEGRRLALALAEALTPSGWIDRPLRAIARELGARPADLEIMLLRLQKIEPVGLFARNLAECLTLQAQEAGLHDRVMKVVLANLDLLARGEFGRIAQVAGVAEAEVIRRFRMIRTMNPKPGTAFDAVMANTLREPDLVVRRIGAGGGGEEGREADGGGAEGWQVSLSHSALPGMRIEAGAGKPEDRAAARALLRLVEARNATLLRVGTEVLRRQTDALDAGPGRLHPMTMAEVAEALGLHESTVSRVVAGTAVDTPHGVWWLRRLFSRAMVPHGGRALAGEVPTGSAQTGSAQTESAQTESAQTGAGAPAVAVSAAGVRDLLARRIAAEDPGAPMSDAALSRSLGTELGVALARRTVAKYRDMMGIPPAHRRRK